MVAAYGKFTRGLDAATSWVKFRTMGWNDGRIDLMLPTGALDNRWLSPENVSG